jgi:hypothetical protein
MEVVLAITTMITASNIASCNILFPAPLRFGIDGNPPSPRLNLVVVGIFSPSAAHPRKIRAAPPSLLLRKVTITNFLARVVFCLCYADAFPQVANNLFWVPLAACVPQPRNLTTISCIVFS